MTQDRATTPESSGVSLDRKVLKQLSRRSDRPGLIHLGLWLVLLAGSGVLLTLSLGTWAVVPAMVLYGALLTVPTYSLSHECAHGTAFRTRWLNETVFWITSLIYSGRARTFGATPTPATTLTPGMRGAGRTDAVPHADHLEGLAARGFRRRPVHLRCQAHGACVPSAAATRRWLASRRPRS